MKTIRLLMMLLSAILFFGCSSDDDDKGQSAPQGLIGTSISVSYYCEIIR